jgi:enoyl-CoA hydratase
VKIISRNNGVAVIQINYPPANGWNEYTSVGVLKRYEEACADDSIKGIVITGIGANFVAGADIQKLSSNQANNVSKRDIIAGIERGHQILEKLESGPKPTVAGMSH